MAMKAFKMRFLKKFLLKSHRVYLVLCNEILMFVHVFMLFYVILQLLDWQTSKKMTEAWEIVGEEIHESLLRVTWFLFLVLAHYSICSI